MALGLSLVALALDRGPAWYFDPRPTNPPGHIIVYSTRWCPACARLRRCLEGNRVPFEERDVEASTRANSEWEALDGYGVPLTVVGQRLAYGMRERELRPALAEAGFTVDCWSAGAPGSALPSSAEPTPKRR